MIILLLILVNRDNRDNPAPDLQDFEMRVGTGGYEYIRPVFFVVREAFG